MNNGQKHRSDHDGGQQSAGQSLGELTVRRRQADSDRSSIRVFTSELPHQSSGARSHGTTAEEEAESQRLITIARQHSLYIDPNDTSRYGTLLTTPTGESKVYINDEIGVVFKVHDPFAKRVLKDMHAEDAIWEHIVHNILFPNSRYTFVGITEQKGDVRIVLSQSFCNAMGFPTDQEISSHLQSMGLLPEDHYYFGNEYLSITDVSADSDNVLKDERGELFFIDPIIKLKKPAPQVIEWLLSKDCPMWQHTDDNTTKHSSTFSLLSKIKKWFTMMVASVLLFSSCIIQINGISLSKDYKHLPESCKERIVDTDQPLDSLRYDGNLYLITTDMLLSHIEQEDSSLVYIWTPYCKSDACCSPQMFEEYCHAHGYRPYIILDQYTEWQQYYNGKSRLLMFDPKQWNTNSCHKYIDNIEIALTGSTPKANNYASYHLYSKGHRVKSLRYLE